MPGAPGVKKSKCEVPGWADAAKHTHASLQRLQAAQRPESRAHRQAPQAQRALQAVLQHRGIHWNWKRLTWTQGMGQCRASIRPDLPTCEEATQNASLSHVPFLHVSSKNVHQASCQLSPTYKCLYISAWPYQMTYAAINPPFLLLCL